MSIDTLSSKVEIDMKLIIFGSTGKIGRELVAQALDQGHHVTAFARNPEKIESSHTNLSVVQGDVLEMRDVKKAVRGSDCVISALGASLMNKDRLREKSIAVLIKAMGEAGIKRLVCLSGLGAGDSINILPFYYKYLLVPLMFRHVFADHHQQEILIMNSQLDWIIARPANFTEGKLTGSYQEGVTMAGKSLKLRISHPDVAGFLLKQVDDDTYLHQTPIISY